MILALILAWVLILLLWAAWRSLPRGEEWYWFWVLLVGLSIFAVAYVGNHS